MTAIIAFKSSLFIDGEQLPKQATCDGADVSPQLSWETPPEGTQSIALLCDDPDAPGKTWVHWVIFNIPPSVTKLEEGVPKEGILLSGAKQGINDFGNIGYGGACPPPGHGTHRYFFKLFALDSALDLDAGATQKEVEEAMQGHILAQGQLMGTYSR